MYSNLENKIVNNNIPDFNENCFDIIRLIAAVIVMFSHSFKWFGYEKPAFMLFLTDGSVGVIILYALSGYLTYASYDRIVKKNGSVWLFWYKRIVRICPLYLLSCVFMIIIDAIRYVEISSVTYIIRRLLNIATFGLIYVPNGITNGVIWSLRVEIVFYFIVPFVYYLLNNKHIGIWIITVIVLWQFNVWDSSFIAAIGEIPLINIFSRIDNPMLFIYEFLIGSMFYCHKEKMVGFFGRKKVIVPVAILFTIWTFLYDKCGIVEKFGEMHNPVYGFIIPFITLGLGYAFGKLRLKFDISYAIFLFHMLIISELLRVTSGGLLWLAASWVLVILVSFAMHYGFEKPVKHITIKIENWLEKKLC